MPPIKMQRTNIATIKYKLSKSFKEKIERICNVSVSTKNKYFI